MPCRVVTWNLWWRFGDWARRFEVIAAELAELAPDVVGLQEVWARRDTNAAGLLARRLGLHWAWVPSPHPHRWQRRVGDSSVAFGNAVLSRWPVAGVAHTDLPAPPAGPPDGRRVLHAALDTPAGRLPFFTTQLSAFPGRSALRCAQARRVAEFVAEHTPDDGLPAVVTGDLNAVPESDEVRLLEGFLTEPAVPDLLLVDAWRYADPGDRGVTWSRANPHAALTGEPDARVDYVLVGLPRGSGAAQVLRARVAGGAPRDGVWPSDHAAVVADLRLGATPHVGPGRRRRSGPGPAGLTDGAAVLSRSSATGLRPVVCPNPACHRSRGRRCRLRQPLPLCPSAERPSLAQAGAGSGGRSAHAAG